MSIQVTYHTNITNRCNMITHVYCTLRNIKMHEIETRVKQRFWVFKVLRNAEQKHTKMYKTVSIDKSGTCASPTSCLYKLYTLSIQVKHLTNITNMQQGQNWSTIWAKILSLPSILAKLNNKSEHKLHTNFCWIKNTDDLNLKNCKYIGRHCRSRVI